jgi:hypothetical protein
VGEFGSTGENGDARSAVVVYSIGSFSMYASTLIVSLETQNQFALF